MHHCCCCFGGMGGAIVPLLLLWGCSGGGSGDTALMHPPWHVTMMVLVIVATLSLPLALQDEGEGKCKWSGEGEVTVVSPAWHQHCWPAVVVAWVVVWHHWLRCGGGMTSVNHPFWHSYYRLTVKQSIKQVNCLRLSTRQYKLLTKGGVEWVHFRGETSRESDWGCQSIPWSLYTIILYVHVGIESTDTAQGRHSGD